MLEGKMLKLFGYDNITAQVSRGYPPTYLFLKYQSTNSSHYLKLDKVYYLNIIIVSSIPITSVILNQTKIIKIYE